MEQRTQNKIIDNVNTYIINNHMLHYIYFCNDNISESSLSKLRKCGSQMKWHLLLYYYYILLGTIIEIK